MYVTSRQFISTSHSLSHLNTFLFLMTVVVLPTIRDSFNTLSCSSPGMVWAVAVVVVTACGAVGGTLRGLVAGRGYTRFSLSPGNVYISAHFMYMYDSLIQHTISQYLEDSRASSLIHK